MPELTMIIGPQAAGKTSWVESVSSSYSEETPWICVAGDHYWGRCALTGMRYWTDDSGIKRSWGLDPIPAHIMSKAWCYVYEALLNSLGQGKNIVLEGTFKKPNDRRRIIHIANHFDYTIHCVCLYPTLYDCVTRNEARLDRVPDVVLARTYAAFIIPTEDEGFTSVRVIKGGDVLGS